MCGFQQQPEDSFDEIEFSFNFKAKKNPNQQRRVVQPQVQTQQPNLLPEGQELLALAQLAQVFSQFM